MTPHLSKGDVFAGYRIQEVVGEGGMGVVYRALHEKFERPAALKVILPQYAADDGFRRRFERESKLAVALQHPNIVPVFEIGDAEGDLFISMPYIRGCLRDQLSAGGLTGSHASGVIAQVAWALHAAHDNNLVHRDIKPGNVLLEAVGPSLHAYLTDFGLAKQVDSKSDLTRSGRWVGTLDYLAPEQIDGRPVDRRADIYALGCVLFEVLTGKVPYPEPGDHRKLWAHLHEHPPPVSQVAPDTDGRFDEVVARAMEKDPDDRFQSAADFGHATLAAADAQIAPPPAGLISSVDHPDPGATTAGEGLGVATPSLAPRSWVTIVRCEVSARAGADPEAVRHARSGVMELMRRTLGRHGPTVHGDGGDAIIAVFGGGEDDAFRAVQAVDHLRGEFELVTQAWAREQLEFRAAVDTGEAVTGEPSRDEPPVTGGPVDIGRRLSRDGPPGRVLLTHATYELVRGAVKVEPDDASGEFALLGVDPTARGVPRRLDSPMVGRAAELEQLNQAFELARRPSCRLVTVLGDAGVGKSRLAREFVRGLDAGVTNLAGRCLAEGDGITFWPLAEVIREAAQIGGRDSPATARAKLSGLLPDDDDRELIVERVSGLLGLSAEPARADETFWAVRRTLDGIASVGPLVIVFDDVHEAERKFIELLEYLVVSTPRAPILFVCLGRLRKRSRVARLAHNRIPLRPLGETASAEVVGNLLGGERVALDVSRYLKKVTDGNPLFLEEMVRRLIGDGLLELVDATWHATGDLQNADVPNSIMALIRTRLARLEPEERSVLERAAVVGESFPRAAVNDLLPAAERRKLGYSLEQLVGKQLLKPVQRAFIDEDGYRFAHVLVRDGVYAGLGRVTRAELHETFAVWLSRHLAERAEEHDELIGYHLERAFREREVVAPPDSRTRELAHDAAERLGSAGSRARERGDMPAAAKLLERAIGLTPSGPSQLDLRLTLGMVIGERGDEGDATNAPDCLEGVAADAAKARISDIATRATMEAKYWRLGSGGPLDVEELRMAAEEAKSLSDEVGRCRAYYHLAFCCSIVGKWDEAARLLERALEHARRAGDPQEQGEVLWFLTGALEHGSMPAREALARLGELLDPARTPNLSARERTLIEAVGRAPLLAMAGELDAAHTLCDHAKAICDDTGQRLRRATVRQVTGRVALLARRLAQANADLDLSFEILDAMGETGFLATTAGLRAEARYLERKPRETLASARVARKAASTDDIEAQVLWAVACAKVMANLGERDWARRLAECAVKSASQSDDLNLRADGELAAAEVAAAEGLLDEVRAKVAAAQKLYEDKGNVVGKRNAAALEERLTGGLRSGRPRNTGASTRH